jgi:hypothetical protein
MMANVREKFVGCTAFFVFFSVIFRCVLQQAEIQIATSLVLVPKHESLTFIKVAIALNPRLYQRKVGVAQVANFFHPAKPPQKECGVKRALPKKLPMHLTICNSKNRQNACGYSVYALLLCCQIS